VPRPRGKDYTRDIRREHAGDPAQESRDATATGRDEQRLYGINACLALFQRRPETLRKVYLTESRLGDLKPVLAWCVSKKLGYRVVTNEDLDKLASTKHHEGVCFDVLRREPLTVDELIALLPAAPKPVAVVVLDGVGNPHNFGAMLRSAANFGVAAVVIPADSTLALSGAACRVAEGGAEAVELARAAPGENVLARLRGAGFGIVATVPRAGEALYETALPARLGLLFGAEGEGLSASMIAGADVRVTVPGTGKVESLNISASAAVLFGEYFRQHFV
jgi:TrmH RNA methyltransferase